MPSFSLLLPKAYQKGGADVLQLYLVAVCEGLKCPFWGLLRQAIACDYRKLELISQEVPYICFSQQAEHYCG